MIKNLFAVVAAFSLSSCATVTRDPALDPIVAQLGSAARLILIGEIHGTVEAPAAFGRIAESASQAWGRVNVGIELPQIAIDEADCGRPEPRAESYWRRPSQDGRTSKAMRSLVCSLKKLEKNRRIKLLAIVPADFNGRSAHPYYETVITAARTGPSRTLLLLGNFHARRAPGALAQLLAQEGVALTAVTVSSPAATAWNCRARDQCGAGRIGAEFCDASPTDVQLVLDKSKIRTPFWDGCLAFPSLSPSPPA
ncbi:MAG TPA: hypothetical protein VE891_08555 [Allosphingosinicella sp.]|nr:hypothetical protein [Allosphingosinicella sp.]